MKKILILFGILFLASCVTSYAIPTYIQQDNFRIASVKDFSGLEIDTIQCLGNCEALFKVDNYEAATASRASIFKFDFSNPNVKVSDVRVYRDVPYTAYDVVTKQEERTCAKSTNGSYCQNDCKDGAVINSVCHYNVTVTTTKPRTAYRKEWVSLGYATKSGVVAIPKSSTEWVKVLFSVPIGSSGKFNLTLGYGDKQIVLDPWWNSGWLSTRPITITELDAVARTNDKIHITLPASIKQHSQADCDDIRIVAGTDTASPWEIPRYIPYCPVGAEEVEIQFPLNVSASGYNGSLAVYYNNPGAAAPAYTEPKWTETSVQYVVNGVATGWDGAHAAANDINMALVDGTWPVSPGAGDRWDTSGPSYWNLTVNITWGVIRLHATTPKFDIYNITFGSYDASPLMAMSFFDVACGVGGNGTVGTTYTHIYNSTEHVGGGEAYIGNFSANITADNQSNCTYLRFHIQNNSNPASVVARTIVSRFFVYGHNRYNYTIGTEVNTTQQNPTIMSVNITPAAPNILQSLNCSATINTDIYASSLGNFTWYTNGAHNATWDDLNLNFTNMTARGSSAGKTPGPLTAGDVWKCEVAVWNTLNANYSRVNSSTVTVAIASVVTINAPTDYTQNVTNNMTVNFTLETFYPTLNVNVSLDGVLQYNVTMTNGTTEQHIFATLSEGLHNITVVTNTTTSTVWFTIHFSNISNVSYIGSVYEVSEQTYNMTINTLYPVLNITLNYTMMNNYSATNISSTVWEQNLTTLLALFNNEVMNLSWSYVLNVSGAYSTRNSSKYSQTLKEAYSITSIQLNTTEVVEGGSVNVTISIRNYSSGGPIVMYAGYNVTNYSIGVRNYSNSAIDYYIIFNTTLVSADTGVNISSFGNVSYMNRSKIISITNSSVLIQNIQLTTTCAGLGAVMIFKAWDEEANHSHLGAINNTVTWEWKIESWIHPGVVSIFSNTTKEPDNLTICISPAGVVLKVNVSMFVNFENYSQREFHFVNYTLTSGTLINYSAHMVNESKTYLIDIYVEDEYNQDMEDVVVYAKRFFYDVGNDTIIASMVTDTLGHVSSYLVWQDVKYSFLIYQGDTLLKYIEPMFMTDPSVTFTMSPEISNILGYLGGIDSSCHYDNVTKTVRCNVTDPSGQMTSARLVVKEFKWFGNNTICEDTQYGNDVTLFCNMTGAAVSTEQYMWTVYVSGSIYPITSGLVVTVGTATFADIGIFVTIGMITIIGGLGMWHPMAAVVGAFVAVVFAAWINFINISVGALAGLAMVILIYAFLARKS